MFEKIKAWIKRKRETAREQQAADRLIKHIEQALGFELYEWQRLYIITGIWQPPEGRLHGRTTAYILRLLLDQSKPLLLYEFSQVAEAGNLYSEYMVIDGKLEKVGDWKVDLSSYAKTTEVTAAIANALTAYAKTADVTKAINAAVAGLIQLDDLSVASTGAGNVVTGLAYDNKTGKFTVTKGLTALTEADFTEITQQEVKAMFA